MIDESCINVMYYLKADMEEESDNDEEIGRYDHRKGRDKLWRLLILPFIPILALIIQTTLSLRASLQYRQEVVEVEEQVHTQTHTPLYNIIKNQWKSLIELIFDKYFGF